MSEPGLRVVIVSGLSGSGKTTAVKALEDAGFFCIDNLPPVLLDTFLLLCRDHPEIPRVGVVIDIRSGAFLSHFETAFARALAEGFQPEVFFLTSDDQVLVRRYSESRRLHPMSREGEDLLTSVRREREVLAPLLDRATLVIDSSDLTVHEFKQTVRERVTRAEQRGMQVRVMSFGFKNGVPREADYMLDVRFLPNPYFVPALRPKSGLDPEIAVFLEDQPLVPTYKKRLGALLDLVVPAHRAEGKARLTIAIGCTGGRHRSVYLAERTAEALRRLPDVDVVVEHRDIAREGGTP